MNGLDKSAVVGVIGAGTMGIGIAQVAAAAGHSVRLFDAIEGAAEKALSRLGGSVAKLVDREKISQVEADALLGRIVVATELADVAKASLVVEAIIEDLEVKRTLFRNLEAIVDEKTILATNTSSISVTLIARDLKSPQRVVGMHFFNPAPIMRLVEVVHGVATAPEIAQIVYATAEAWGKVAVHAKSTPGFIVNRVARSYYAEPLRLYEEGVADPATIDSVLTEGAGFRMGPFALMDLIGNDVNYAVSRSVFDAFYGEPRFRPSNIQLELVNAGHLGRKSGRGFYGYAADADVPEPSTLYVADETPVRSDFAARDGAELDGVAIRLSDGRTAATIAAGEGRPIIVLDIAATGAKRIAFSVSADVPEAVIETLAGSLAATGLRATRLADWPGLVALRTISMIANEGFEAVLQGVATERAVDEAMRHGVNYPKGPMAWAREIGLPRILSVLDTLHSLTGDPRYRASLALRNAVSNSANPKGVSQ